MLLDLLISVVFSTIIGILFDTLSLSFILFGITAGLLVDLDFLIWWYRNDRKVDEYTHEHRDIFHIPILFSLALSVIWLILLGFPYAIVWLVLSLYHFIHDTFSGGWGVRWLYPFSSGYWTLVRYSPKRYYQNKTEQREYVAKHGDKKWFEKEKKKGFAYLLFFAALLMYFGFIFILFGF